MPVLAKTRWDYYERYTMALIAILEQCGMLEAGRTGAADDSRRSEQVIDCYPSASASRQFVSQYLRMVNYGIWAITTGVSIRPGSNPKLVS